MLRSTEVIYDMDAEAFNKIVTYEGGVCILILCCLPKNPAEWLLLSEEQLILRRCCYWTQLGEEPTTNVSTRRISLPRAQLFTPQAVQELLERRRQGTL